MAKNRRKKSGWTTDVKWLSVRASSQIAVTNDMGVVIPLTFAHGGNEYYTLEAFLDSLVSGAEEVRAIAVRYDLSVIVTSDAETQIPAHNVSLWWYQNSTPLAGVQACPTTSNRLDLVSVLREALAVAGNSNFPGPWLAGKGRVISTFDDSAAGTVDYGFLFRLKGTVQRPPSAKMSWRDMDIMDNETEWPQTQFSALIASTLPMSVANCAVQVFGTCSVVMNRASPGSQQQVV